MSESVKGSLLLSTARKLALTILTGRIAIADKSTDQSNGVDSYLNLLIPKNQSLDHDIHHTIKSRDEETLIDIVALKDDGTSQLIERWMIHHELFDGFNAPTPQGSRNDSAALVQRMVCLTRALSAYMMQLPASRVARACQSYADQHRASPVTLRYFIQQTSSSNNSASQRTFQGPATSFLFSPAVVTPRGKFRLNVHYRTDLSDLDFAPLESDRFVLGGKMPLEIVEDYATVKANDQARQNIHTRSQSSNFSNEPSPNHSSRSRPSQTTPHSLPQHLDTRRHSPVHNPITSDRNLPHSHSSPLSMPETPKMDDHASSPPIAIPRPNHSHSSSLTSHSHGHSPYNQYSSSVPSRSSGDRRMSPSLSSVKPIASVSPVSPYMGPHRRSSVSSTPTPRSMLLAHPPSMESASSPVDDLISSSTSSLSREAQLGHEIQRVSNIAPLRSCFTSVDGSTMPKLRTRKANKLMDDAQRMLNQDRVMHQDVQPAHTQHEHQQEAV